MEILKRVVNNKELQVLHISSMDDEDTKELVKNDYTLHKNIEIDLGLLQCLYLFEEINTLIIKSGMVCEEGLKQLYQQKKLETLVLDFEETESEEEAIDLSYFPKLKYVLSRSNLNICNYENRILEDLKVEILNYYRNGKKIKGDYPDNYDLFQKKKFLFLSAEAQSPVSIPLVKILVSVENMFQEQYGNTIFSEKLENISIIPICVSEDMVEQGFGKERKYISQKKGFADIRICIPYLEFIESEEKHRAALCKKNIMEAAEYIKKKDKTYKSAEFMCAINSVFEKLYSI